MALQRHLKDGIRRLRVSNCGESRMNRVFGIARGDDPIVSNIVEKDQQPDTQNLGIC